ncbi:LuxR C-terminal-related transcriptional regulator [Pseudogemmobacter bohemicus]|uniref:LuxR C-terminal-related transcriptional regulator n=1 Tax=Pseudogemmobacter bohemicus TaxID=2250708 RepID=UPI000DD3574D|nr:LuxR C-terminal-related transcriptional regulator [Pseudogemmobacter bohemicus]
MFNSEAISQQITNKADAIHFSPRESEVLPLLMQGHSSKEIARDLNISPRTVDIYRASILAKMRIRKTSQLFLAVHKIMPQLANSI